MQSIANTRELVDDIFEEEAHVLGDLFQEFGAQGELVDRTFRSLRMIRDRAMQRIDGLRTKGTEHGSQFTGGTGPHPAIEKFLEQIGRS